MTCKPCAEHRRRIAEAAKSGSIKSVAVASAKAAFALKQHALTGKPQK